MVYFYFDFNDGGRITFSALLQSLVTQLSLQCDTLPPALLEIYKAHQESTKLIDDVALTKLFRELVLSFQEMYIIVDALNESNEVDQVVELMQAIQDWKHPNLHLAVTSRQLPEIEASLRDLVTNKVCLHEAGMKEDIGLYIDEKFRTDKKLSKWPADIKSQIKLKLLEAKCGMYVFLSAISYYPADELLGSNGLYVNSTCCSVLYQCPPSAKSLALVFPTVWIRLTTTSGCQSKKVISQKPSRLWVRLQLQSSLFNLLSLSSS